MSFRPASVITCLSHTSALIRVKKILYFENINVKLLINRLNTEELTKTNKE